MRIHTNLTSEAMHVALRQSGAPISFHTLTEHGSRTHARAFDVRLEGTGGASNTGLYGAGDYSGATWDEWGAFFGALFELSPSTRAGGSAARPVYANADDYHFQTGDRFHFVAGRGHLPADTHPRHRWVYLGTPGDRGVGDSECSKCSAHVPSRATADARRANAA